MIPAPVARYRTEARATLRARHYRGRLHLTLQSGACLVAIGYCLGRLRAPQIAEALALPVFFLIANLAEYAAHRGPMHHRWSWLPGAFTAHVQGHHRFYTAEAMTAEEPIDIGMTLFSPGQLLLFVALLLVPIALLFGAWRPNFGWLFAACALAYYLNYEWLHLSHHSAWGHRLPCLRTLARLHTEHHDPRRMARARFNITYPIADWLFGTQSEPYQKQI